MGFKRSFVDAAGEETARRIREDLGIRIRRVRTVKVYTLEGKLGRRDLPLVADELFTDPVVERSTIDHALITDADWAIEVGFLPGVTDTVGQTATEGIADVLGQDGDGVRVYTATQYLLYGGLPRKNVEGIAADLLANELIHRISIWKPSGTAKAPLKAAVPKVQLDTSAPVEIISLDHPDRELELLSRERLWALDIREMKAVQEYYTRAWVRRERKGLGISPGSPMDAEIEALAQTWSEHCKHKIFNARIFYDPGDGSEVVVDSLFDTYIRRATEEIGQRVDWLMSVFHDNAGVIRLNRNWNLVFKVETHNSPSALDPYGGALTGIVGVNRDPLGTGRGCRLIFNTDTFCFAPPNLSKRLPEKLLHPKRVFRGVHQGVRDGANMSGVPDVNGSIVFDDRYAGKPLVFCGTGGLMRASVQGYPTHEKHIDPGDLIVMVGGRIGKDGIHGATFSSEELHEGSPSTAVQIGDPITQKKMVDFILEARDRGLFNCITDNGAGGLSCSVGEMGRYSGGCEMHLERAPLKYEGLTPWEILLSEAQERMTLAVPKDKITDFCDLAAKRCVEATVLGEFNDSGRFHALHNGKTVAYLDMDFLHNGVPQMELKARWEEPPRSEPDFACPEDLASLLHRVLARLNVCSKENFVRQYDHEVQGMSVVKPFVGAENDGPSDAAVLRPLLNSNIGIAVASGICPRYSDFDAYHMACCAVDEAVRNVVAVGGQIGRIAGLDNFCWPDPVQSEKTPDGEYKLAQLVRACMALYDICIAYDLPCISGKDSMKNDFKMGDTKISVPPTLLFSVMGIVKDVRKAVTMDAKRSGDLVYLVGTTHNELGGSEYCAEMDCTGGTVPEVRFDSARALYEKLGRAIERGLAASCHDCSDGGLAVALAETAFAGGLGMKVNLAEVPCEEVDREDFLLFSESQSRFVVTVSPGKQEKFERALRGIPFGHIGKVTRSMKFIVMSRDGKNLIQEDIQSLKESWQKPLAW